MSEQSSNGAGGPREVFGRLEDAILRGDQRARADLYADEAVSEFPFAPPGWPAGIVIGAKMRETILSREPQFSFDEVRTVAFHETTDPETAVIELELHGRRISDDRPVHLAYVWVLKARDGRILHLREYNNTLALAEAMGGMDALNHLVAQATSR